MAMTDAEMEAERRALLAEERDLDQAHQRLHLTPDDRPGHAAHSERLNQATRVRAFKAALQQRESIPRCATAAEGLPGPRVAFDRTVTPELLPISPVRGCVGDGVRGAN